MNKVNVVTVMLRRMYRTKRGREFAGIRKKFQLETKDSETVNPEDFDEHDISEYEADFLNVAESHKVHVREMKMKKQRLKQQMVKKYFEEKEPRFLTYAEMELIRNLHKSDPDEWPVEKLSESFPALSETISKILRAKWIPKSVENVMRYDNAAVENWKNFRSGKLVVNPILNEHLMKFKNRKIILTDRESLAAKFVQSKPVFQKPKSQLFSSIVQNYINKQQDDVKLLLQDSSDKNLDVENNIDKNQNPLSVNISSDYSSVAIDSSKKSVNEKENLTLQTNSKETDIAPCNNDGSGDNKNKSTRQLFTFNEFVKAGLDNKFEMSSEETQTLLNIRRTQVDANQEILSTEITAAHDKAVIKPKRNSVPCKKENDDSDIVSADDNLTDTYVKVWNKKIDNECNYMKPIKITKSVHKPGMTYRISDCYYDDDGEFLYRVPGMRS